MQRTIKRQRQIIFPIDFLAINSLFWHSFYGFAIEFHWIQYVCDRLNIFFVSFACFFFFLLLCYGFSCNDKIPDQMDKNTTGIGNSQTDREKKPHTNTKNEKHKNDNFRCDGALRMTSNGKFSHGLLITMWFCCCCSIRFFSSAQNRHSIGDNFFSVFFFISSRLLFSWQFLFFCSFRHSFTTKIDYKTVFNFMLILQKD